MSQFPGTISVPGGGGGGGPSGDPGVDSSSSVTSAHQGDNNDNLRKAIMFIQAYMEGEQDDEDLAQATKILSQAQTLLANQQKMVDSATGAGPGAKLVRKATAAGSGGGGSSY